MNENILSSPPLRGALIALGTGAATPIFKDPGQVIIFMAGVTIATIATLGRTPEERLYAFRHQRPQSATKYGLLFLLAFMAMNASKEWAAEHPQQPQPAPARAPAMTGPTPDKQQLIV